MDGKLSTTVVELVFPVVVLYKHSRSYNVEMQRHQWLKVNR